MPKHQKRAVVFDLDDTIGHFEEVSMFLSGLQFIAGKEIKESFLFKLLDLWPKFLRPGIFDILNLLKKEKKKNKHLKVIIYTNNMGPRSWTLLIKRYLEKKINYRLFDKTITAYRPFSKINCRTTHEKTFEDFLKCSKLPHHTQIFFLDDQYHPRMHHSQIIYLHLHPYDYGIPYHKMIHTFLASKTGKIIPVSEQDKFRHYMFNFLNSGHGKQKYIVRHTHIQKKDRIQTKIIKHHLRRFLNIQKTRRRHHTRRWHARRRKHRTRKNH